jgi:Glycosyl hydrolase family 57
MSIAPSTTVLSNLPHLASSIEGLPNFAGSEAAVRSITHTKQANWLPRTTVQFDQISAGFAIALHMHQPTIPAGIQGALISNLQQMFEHPHDGDNHNAGTFLWCYTRMAEFIPELVNQGCQPKVMLDYSGNLLWGLEQIGQGALDRLRSITTDPTYQPYVEWLGTTWSHAVAPSTPIPDFKLHVSAWQHHFAAIFGWPALSRVKGFSPPEMHLPNHPDTLYEFVKALVDSGYQWVMVQEHSIETLNGQPIANKHLPQRLVATNSMGETISITVLVKTQGSDTKLVGQMQPYYEAKTLARQEIQGISVPSLVTQIGDGENGGVMMNEFPRAFQRTWQEVAQDQSVTGMTGSEYLELMTAAGCQPADYPSCQAIGQHLIWQKVDAKKTTPAAVEKAIAELQQEHPNFHMDGASWTNDLSWVKGYENVLTPMSRLSTLFHQKVTPLIEQHPELTGQVRYRTALLYNLLLQTSCFRYWGQGAWTDYAKNIYTQGTAIINQEFQ